MPRLMPRPPTDYTADSDAGRLLLALRAGPTTAAELAERFGRSHGIGALERRGLVVSEAGAYRLTEAGRAACPLGNPLAAGIAPPVVAKLPPEPAMPAPQYTSSRTTVLRHLTAAGAQGVTRQALLRVVDDERTLNTVIQALVRNGQAVRPQKGLLVAAEFAGQHAGLAALTAPLTPPPAPVAAPAVQPQVTDDNSGSETAGPTSLASTRREDAPSPAVAAAGEGSPVADDIRFALWEDGQLDICTPRGVLEIPPATTDRLIRFLGLTDMDRLEVPL